MFQTNANQNQNRAWKSGSTSSLNDIIPYHSNSLDDTHNDYPYAEAIIGEGNLLYYLYYYFEISISSSFYSCCLKSDLFFK